MSSFLQWTYFRDKYDDANNRAQLSCTALQDSPVYLAKSSPVIFLAVVPVPHKDQSKTSEWLKW